jgi:ribosomal protein S27AE
MGIFRTTGRAIAREGAYIVGYQHIGAGWRTLRANWQRVTRRACPRCGKSELFAFSEVIEGESIAALGCGKCDYFEFAASKEDDAGLTRLSLEVQETLAKDGEHAGRMRHFQRASRIFYVLSVVCLIASAVFIMFGSRMFITPAMAGALVLTQALVASYRCWQLRESRLFQRGSFKVWIKTGEWFV